MVEMKVVLKASSEKRKSTQVLPTPESPMSSSLNSRSYVFFAMEQAHLDPTLDPNPGEADWPGDAPGAKTIRQTVHGGV